MSDVGSWWCGIGAFERGCRLHRTRPYRTGLRRRPPDHGPDDRVRPCRSGLLSLMPAGRGSPRLCDGLDAAVPTDPVDALGDRRPEADEEGRAPRDDLGARERGEQPGRRRRIAVEGGVGDADLHDRMRVGDRDAGQPVLERERLRVLVAMPDDARVVRLDPVDERRQARHRASRSSDPRIRSNGCGIPTSPPCSRAAAIVSTADSPGGIARSRKTQIRSPSVVLTSSPTMTVRPAGASSRASSATSIRSWSVIARCVSPRACAAFTMSSGVGQTSRSSPSSGNAGR